MTESQAMSNHAEPQPGWIAEPEFSVLHVHDGREQMPTGTTTRDKAEAVVADCRGMGARGCRVLRRHVATSEWEPVDVLPCDPYCHKHPACRLRNDQPVHYFDCERFNVTHYGTRQGKCDCTATADVNAVLAVRDAT